MFNFRISPLLSHSFTSFLTSCSSYFFNLFFSFSQALAAYQSARADELAAQLAAAEKQLHQSEGSMKAKKEAVHYAFNIDGDDGDGDYDDEMSSCSSTNTSVNLSNVSHVAVVAAPTSTSTKTKKKAKTGGQEEEEGVGEEDDESYSTAATTAAAVEAAAVSNQRAVAAEARAAVLSQELEALRAQLSHAVAAASAGAGAGGATTSAQGTGGAADVSSTYGGKQAMKALETLMSSNYGSKESGEGRAQNGLLTVEGLATANAAMVSTRERKCMNGRECFFLVSIKGSFIIRESFDCIIFSSFNYSAPKFHFNV